MRLLSSVPLSVIKHRIKLIVGDQRGDVVRFKGLRRVVALFVQMLRKMIELRTTRQYQDEGSRPSPRSNLTS